jgi:hypothetical protein
MTTPPKVPRKSRDKSGKIRKKEEESGSIRKMDQLE